MFLLVILNNYLFDSFSDNGDNIQGDNEFGKSSVISGNKSVNSEEEISILDERKWLIKSPMPTSRSGAAVATVDGKIYVIGGYNAEGYLIQFAINERYDPQTDKWEEMAPMPQARSGAVAAVVDGKIYVIGGLDKDNNLLSQNERYNPKTNIWEVLSPMPTPRAAPAIGVVDKKIYVIGGGGNPYIYEISAANEEYDPYTNKWTAKKFLSSPRWRPAFSVFDDKIYVIGGWGENGTTGLNERYDPETDEWETLAPMPTSRTAATAQLVDKKIYVIGGYKIVAADMVFLSKNEEYNIALDRWTTRIHTPILRAGIAGGVVNNKIYIIGGVSKLDMNSDGMYSSLNEEYKPSE